MASTSTPRGSRADGGYPHESRKRLSESGRWGLVQFADLDGDGDLDAILGSPAGPLLLTNTGSKHSPAFATPSGPIAGFVGLHDVPVFVDIDGDRDLDGLANVNDRCLWFRNDGSVENSSFSGFRPNTFGLSGADALPVVSSGDLDGDGDLDALVGTVSGNLLFFENTGSPVGPTFASPVNQPFGLTTTARAAPWFADIDHDGDLDLFVGRDDGKTIFFANVGTTTSPTFGPALVNPFGLSDVGTNARPSIVDFDHDGDLDALVGNDVAVFLFQNTGSASNPSFASASQVALVGAEIHRPVFVDLDGDGDFDVLFDPGHAYGLEMFKNVGTPTTATFQGPSAAAALGLVGLGSGASPTFADLDGDGDIDGLIGDITGQILYFENLALSPVFNARFESGGLDEWSSHVP